MLCENTEIYPPIVLILSETPPFVRFASAIKPFSGFSLTNDKKSAFKSSLLAPFRIKSRKLKTPSSNKQFLNVPVEVILIRLQSLQILRVKACSWMNCSNSNVVLI